MQKTIAILAIALTVALTGCDAFGQAMTSHRDVVARAAGHELMIEDAAALIGDNPRLPAEPAVVEAVANLWVDYVLLATAAAQDSTLESIDLEAIIQPQLEQEMVYRLRDEVITVDTAISEDELRRLFEQEQPELAIRARHILIRSSPQDPESQRDSARARAARLQARAAAGEDFAALARDFSEEPGAADRGGDLGFFRRGQMVGPFEEAAFALDVGQVSDVVETPFGFHVIKVEEKQVPNFDEQRTAFRQYMLQKRQSDAEDQYVSNITGPLELEVQEGAYDVVRELATSPDASLSRRAGNRALVGYQGGELSASEFLAFIRQRAPAERAQFAAAADEQLEQVLTGLATNEILILQARERGLEPSPATVDSIRTELRAQLRQAVAASNLAGITPQDGESRDEAVERRVTALLQEIIRGERQVLPLGPISYSLREQLEAEVYKRAFPEVVSRVESMRGTSGLQPGGELPMPAPEGAAPPQGALPPQGTAPQPQPDTSGAD